MMFKRLMTLALLSVYSISSYANIVIVGTRVIYPAEQKSIGVQLNNVHDNPALAQVWLDNGTNDEQNTAVPFSITPPISRLEGKTSQTIRIRHTGSQAMPQDRESLYYFNLLDVPPKSADSDTPKNSVQFVLRSRLKFFYRPAKLPYPVTESYEKVTWHLSNQKLIIKNPTPYHITYTHVALSQDKKELEEIPDVGMIAPFSEKSVPVNKPISHANSVSWYIINDYGADYGNVSPLQRQ